MDGVQGQELYKRSFTGTIITNQATGTESATSVAETPISSTFSTTPETKPRPTIPGAVYGPRIAVVGDRLFTDTLLANRLRLLLPSRAGTESVISIQTTSLPDPKDVRLFRRLESFLTRDRLRSGSTDWGRFAISDKPAEGDRVEDTEGWKRYIPLRKGYLAAPELRWDPRSWRPVTMIVATAKGVAIVGKFGMVQIRRAGRWAWEKGKVWYSQGKIGQEEMKEISKEGMP